MKKLIDTSFLYAIAALAGGVFFREFTKFNGFTERTSLGLVHTHLFLLGMLFFLLAALLERPLAVTAHAYFKRFFGFYNCGLVLTAVMLFVRGVTQVLALPLSRGLDASISGIAGIGHILLATGLVFFFLILKKQAAAREAVPA